MRLKRRVEARPRGELCRPVREFCLYPESHMKSSQGFKLDHICDLSPAFIPLLYRECPGPWVFSCFFPPKHSLCLPPGLKPGSAPGTLLPFQPCSFRFQSYRSLPFLHQLETVSAFLPIPTPSINLGDFITHLCLLVLDCFSRDILHATLVILFPSNAPDLAITQNNTTSSG